jgi:hypothetical protein
MSSMSTQYPRSKGLVSVSPINWLPGSVNGALPFFSVQNGVLYFRADDPNLYGITYQGGLMSVPPVCVNNRKRLGNKGYNFYSAPWCIPTLACRDTGKRVEVTSIHPSIYTYIESFYKNLTGSLITLTNFDVVSMGYAKQYQIVYGNQYNNVSGRLYFGGTGTSTPGTGGVDSLIQVTSPNINVSKAYTYDGSPLPTYQQPYNTFYAIDTPIIISAVDSSNESTKLYFTLQNQTTTYNSPNFSQ